MRYISPHMTQKFPAFQIDFEICHFRQFWPILGFGPKIDPPVSSYLLHQSTRTMYHSIDNQNQWRITKFQVEQTFGTHFNMA
tara:strand:+ start:540 stop:785 length:246 start_codon:yes stop_codon:yes gene_type:complete